MLYTIRPLRAEDAEAVAALQRALNAQEGYPTHLFTPEVVWRDALGPRPFVGIHIAEQAGEIVGYALHHDCYESSRAARGRYIADLYVAPQARRQGIARALLGAVAAQGRGRGIVYLLWNSLPANAQAHAMYTAVGAEEIALFMHVVGAEAFDRLAAIGSGGQS